MGAEDIGVSERSIPGADGGNAFLALYRGKIDSDRIIDALVRGADQRFFIDLQRIAVFELQQARAWPGVVIDDPGADTGADQQYADEACAKAFFLILSSPVYKPLKAFIWSHDIVRFYFTTRFKIMGKNVIFCGKRFHLPCGKAAEKR